MTLDFAAVSMIWRRELLRISRDKPQLAGSIARPVLWLVVLGWGMGSVFQGFEGMRYIDYLFPGVVAMNLLFASFLSAISIIWDREFGFLKEMLVAPISRLSIALGKAELQLQRCRHRPCDRAPRRRRDHRYHRRGDRHSPGRGPRRAGPSDREAAPPRHPVPPRWRELTGR